MRRKLLRRGISYKLWQMSVGRFTLFAGLTAAEKARLRMLSALFLYEKKIVPVQGVELTDIMRVQIAAQACLPILKIGLERLSGWRDLIVYPGPFRVRRENRDATGVVHRREQILSGESWLRGPLIVSWADVEKEMFGSGYGRNVVIHEVAHKLDILNGVFNGFPPLHAEMSIPLWTAVMSGAYQALLEQVELQLPSIDSYAASSPAEFFAVTSEYFFCSPVTLYTHFADVYRQLRCYYRQDPLLRQRYASLSAESGLAERARAYLT